MSAPNERMKLDFSEKGRDASGQPDSMDRRLFIQLLCFTGCNDISKLTDALQAENIPAVLYRDLNDPKGVGLLTYSEEPEHFVGKLRDFINQSCFAELTPRPEMTMLGRTYSIGYETDLEYILFKRPLERALNPELQWCIWYPLRRDGSFETLSEQEQMAILREHGTIGIAFSEADYGHDIRLACHGLDKNDNDFVIGILGNRLAPLSGLVQRMRKTQQTSRYLESLGPFFIGHVAWQAPMSV